MTTFPPLARGLRAFPRTECSRAGRRTAETRDEGIAEETRSRKRRREGFPGGKSSSPCWSCFGALAWWRGEAGSCVSVVRCTAAGHARRCVLLWFPPQWPCCSRCAVEPGVANKYKSGAEVRNGCLVFRPSIIHNIPIPHPSRSPSLILLR